MAEPNPERPFFPGQYSLVTINEIDRRNGKPPTIRELELLSLRAEGFSPNQVISFGITETAAASRRVSVNRRLGTTGVSQPIAVCFDREIFQLDPSAIERNCELAGNNPYRLTEMEIAALRCIVLNVEYQQSPYGAPALDNAALRMRRKMSLEAGSIPFGQALLYKYISDQDIRKLAQTETVNSHFTETHVESLEFMVLGMKPTERSVAQQHGARRAMSIIQEINAMLGTNSILQSIIKAINLGILSSSSLAERLVADKPYTISDFISLLNDKERRLLRSTAYQNGAKSTSPELARRLKTTKPGIDARFKKIKDKFDLDKIQARVVYIEAVRRDQRDKKNSYKRRLRQERAHQKFQAEQDAEALRQIEEQTLRRRTIIEQILNQHSA